MLVTLAWPDRRLTPNAKRRKNWRAYQPAIKADRAAACILTRAVVPVSAREAIAATEGKIPLTIRFYPPDARLRDDDGIIGAFKHMRDGIADALGVDDHMFLPDYQFMEPHKPGRVEVVLGAKTRRSLPRTAEFCTVNGDRPFSGGDQ